MFRAKRILSISRIGIAIVIGLEEWFVLNTQVVGEQAILNLAHECKFQYYSENSSLRRAIAINNGTEEVSFFYATLLD